MKIRVIKRGIYSTLNKEFKELPIGTKLDVKEIPHGWKNRVEVLEDESETKKPGRPPKEAVTNPAPSGAPVPPNPAE